MQRSDDRRPRTSLVCWRHTDGGVVMNRRAHQFRKEQVRAVLDSDAHGLVEARSRIENDQAVRGRTEHLVEGRGRVLTPAPRGR